MKTFKQFIQKLNENKYTEVQGKVFIEAGDENTEWKLTLDVSKIYTDYESKTISMLDFNNEYATTFTNNSENIANTIGASCWQELEPVILNELKGAKTFDEAEPVYDKIYNLCDKYEILIKQK